MHKLADPHYGLDHKAQALVALLSHQEPAFAKYDEQAQSYDICVQTKIYYEKDRGLAALVLYPTRVARGLCKVVVFGEDHNSDKIIVQDWEILDLRGVCPRPGLDVCFEQVYFNAGDVGKTKDYILRLLTEGYKDMQEDPETQTLLQAVMGD